MKIFVAILFLTSINAFASTAYITGVQKVTFRSGPGTDNKILKMIESDSKVNLLEEGQEWSKVVDQEGVEGYVLNRFLDKAVPSSVKYSWLKSEYEKLKSSMEEINSKNQEIKKELSQTQKDLSKTQSDLSKTSGEFSELKDGSANYLKLKSDHDKTISYLDEQTQKVKNLESQLIKHYIYWFLAGGGVLLVGFILGGLNRKKSGYGSSIRL